MRISRRRQGRISLSLLMSLRSLRKVLIPMKRISRFNLRDCRSIRRLNGKKIRITNSSFLSFISIILIWEASKWICRKSILIIRVVR